MSNPSFIINKTVLAGLFKTLFADKDFLSGDLTMLSGDSIDINISIRVDNGRMSQNVVFVRNKNERLIYDTNTGTWIQEPVS